MSSDNSSALVATHGREGSPQSLSSATDGHKLPQMGLLDRVGKDKAMYSFWDAAVAYR